MTTTVKPWIIEKLRQEQQRRQRENVLQIPLYAPLPEMPAPKKPEEPPPRRIVVIDL
jgi:hypothetical protein